MILDTILDALFCLVDLVCVAIDPSVENYAALAADVACLAIPFATGGGMVTRGISAATKAIDTIQTVDKANTAEKRI